MRWTPGCVAILFLAACAGGDDTVGETDHDPAAGDPDAAAGADEAQCGPWSCDGCCDGDTCRPGDGDDECGAGGAACQSCGRWGECRDAAVCELAAASRWDLVIESASVSALNHDGTDWDSNGDLPDVYVRATLSVGDEVRSERTASREDLAPTWSETLFADLPAGALEGMQLELWDSDGNADDSFGACTAAVRLEDAAAGALAIDCPRSLASGTSEVPARAGWRLQLRLEPRSEGRPDAPPLDRHAVAALTSEPGSCTITWTRDGVWEATYSHDGWGREVGREEAGADPRMWDCSADDRCEAPGALPLVRRMEPGPFGRRVRVEEGDLDSRRVSLYDGLGRLVARHDYDASGRLDWRFLYSYAARRKVQHLVALGDDQEIAATEFDPRGSPIQIASSSLVEKLALDQGGLPVRYQVSDSTNADIPIGTTWEVAYQGAGCAAVLAAEVTNGALRP